MDMRGFIYVGRVPCSNVSKIGFTTRPDPEAYVIQRFEKVLEINNLVSVTLARHAEKVACCAFKRYRLENSRPWELFVDLPDPQEVQATLSWVAQLVDHPERLQEYVLQNGIQLFSSAESSNEARLIEEEVEKELDAYALPDPSERLYLADFCGVRYVHQHFLDTFGVCPVDATTFLLQVVDPGYGFDGEEIGRRRFPHRMVAMARELLQVLGFAHPLDHEHVTASLEEHRPALASTTFFQEYLKNVKLFHARALGNTNVLATQKLATIALNHVFGMLGLRLKSTSKGRQDVKGGGEDGRKRRRAYMYGGWYLERSPGSETRPIVGPPGVDLMGQLLNLRVAGPPQLKARISSELRAYLDGVELKWPELVKSDDIRTLVRSSSQNFCKWSSII